MKFGLSIIIGKYDEQVMVLIDMTIMHYCKNIVFRVLLWYKSAVSIYFFKLKKFLYFEMIRKKR